MIIAKYISDLHLEFRTKIPLITQDNANILILAGDVGNPYEKTYLDFITDVSNNFEKIFLITGNHEYYNKKKTINEINIHIENLINNNNLNNVVFLNNSCYVYKNFRFVGSTLWSNITNNNYKYLTNCFSQIKDLKARELGLDNAINNYNILFNNNYNFLENVPNDEYTNVFITHHLPSYQLIDKQYEYCQLNQCFASSCENLFANTKYWFYGHTHTQSIKTIDNTLFLCNPIGYPNENKNNDYNKTILLETK